MQCNKCGSELPAEAKFCLMCGAPVDAAEPTEPEDAAGKPTLEEDPVVDAGAGSASPEQPDGEGHDEAAAEAPDEEEAGEPAAPADDPDEEAIPEPYRLEEPLAPMAAGAVPMVPIAAPPRVMRLSQRTPRPYAAPAERLASRSATAYQPRPAETSPEEDPEEAPFAQDITHAEPGMPSFSLKSAASDLKGLGTRVARSFKATAWSKKIAIAACVIVALTLGIAFVTMMSSSWFGPLADRSEEPPRVQLPDSTTGAVEPIQQQDPEEPGDGPAALPEGAPEVRSAVADYSWAELSQISALIAGASSDTEALDLAKAYHLCTDDGKLDGTQAKDLELTNGTVLTMRVAGFRQDHAAGGDNSAVGVTFIAKDALASQPMDAYARMAGGWEGSTLREWLNGEVAGLLPEEVSSLVVEVGKATNPALGTGQTQQQITAERLWAPSYSEVLGALPSYSKRASSYVAEGDQYQLFADAGVTLDTGGSALAIDGASGDYPEHWWVRSPDPVSSEYFLAAPSDGSADWTAHRPATPHPIIVGFCL